MLLNEKMGKVMAISDEEANQLIDAIEQALPPESLEPGRDAIIDFLQQWRAEIEAGRPIDRKLKVAESPGLRRACGRAARAFQLNRRFRRQKDYRPTERLDLLLEALGLSFVAPPMMAARFLETVERYRVDEANENPATISLAPTGRSGIRRCGWIVQRSIKPLRRSSRFHGCLTNFRARPAFAFALPMSRRRSDAAPLRLMDRDRQRPWFCD
ncbi:hypothetical protein P0F65_22955 [Sphingomonas sp. I4]